MDLKNSDKPVFVVLARGYCAKDSILNQNKGTAELSPESTQDLSGFTEDIGKLDPRYPVAFPYMYPYSNLLAAYLTGKGFNVLELPPTWIKADSFTDFNSMKQLVTRVSNAMGRSSVFSESLEALQQSSGG